MATNNLCSGVYILFELLPSQIDQIPVIKLFVFLFKPHIIYKRDEYESISMLRTNRLPKSWRKWQQQVLQ